MNDFQLGLLLVATTSEHYKKAVASKTVKAKTEFLNCLSNLEPAQLKCLRGSYPQAKKWCKEIRGYKSLLKTL